MSCISVFLVGLSYSWTVTERQKTCLSGEQEFIAIDPMYHFSTCKSLHGLPFWNSVMLFDWVDVLIWHVALGGEGPLYYFHMGRNSTNQGNYSRIISNAVLVTPQLWIFSLVIPISRWRDFWTPLMNFICISLSKVALDFVLYLFLYPLCQILRGSNCWDRVWPPNDFWWWSLRWTHEKVHQGCRASRSSWSTSYRHFTIPCVISHENGQLQHLATL